MKNRFLISAVALIAALLVIFTSCAVVEPCVIHTDSDGNGICNVCNQQICNNHRDANDDGKCDNGGESYSDACDIHRDANDDGKCDNGGESYSDACDIHRDANDDGKCDNGGESYSDDCDIHRDANDDEKCDACGESFSDGDDTNPPAVEQPEAPAITYQQPDISGYSGELQITLNNGVPSFTKQQLAGEEPYEYYSERDSLGRCRITVALIGIELMPEPGSRGNTGSFTPTGWQPNFYERCHLIGWQLTGEDSNKDNLISGTDDLNAAMQLIENSVASYLRANTENHVLYRVTPIFEGDNLLATGVHMEAFSIEDNGNGVCFNYFLYNVEQYYDIDYSDGTYKMNDEAEVLFSTYAINITSGKVHIAGASPCTYVAKTKPENLVFSTAESWAELLENWSVLGVSKSASPCATCDPDTKLPTKATRIITIIPPALCKIREEY